MKKVLLIFGSKGALGQGITRVMFNKDYDEIFLFDSKKNVEANQNKNIIHVQTKDLSVEENVIEAFNNIEPDKNKLFFLYSTVGGYNGGEFLWGTNYDDWSKMLNVNLNTSFLIAKYFSKKVEESAGGSICFTAAYTGLQAQSKAVAYGVSKAGLIHLVESLAMEGEQIKLSVNAIAPYIIDTKANREWGKESDFAGWIKPEEIGELAYNLFSSFNFISGNVLKLKIRFEI